MLANKPVEMFERLQRKAELLRGHSRAAGVIPAWASPPISGRTVSPPRPRRNPVVVWIAFRRDCFAALAMKRCGRHSGAQRREQSRRDLHYPSLIQASSYLLTELSPNPSCFDSNISYLTEVSCRFYAVFCYIACSHENLAFPLFPPIVHGRPGIGNGTGVQQNRSARGAAGNACTGTRIPGQSAAALGWIAPSSRDATPAARRAPTSGPLHRK